MEVKEKRRVAVLGLGETGLASALFLRRRGYTVFVSDSQASKILEERAKLLRGERIPCELRRHSLEKIASCDWVLISPGISPACEVYRLLERKGVPLVSELEVAAWFSPGRVTAVTGTSGKTTVTTLLQRVYQANGLASVACGNIGNPWIGEIDGLRPESEVVLEVSSFQLQHTHTFRPSLGILLNVGANHLDWHSDFNAYLQAKLRLFRNQTVKDDALVRRSDRDQHFPHFPFQARLVYFTDWEGDDLNGQLLHAVTEIRGLDPEKTREAIAQFEGLEHRLERAGEIDGIRFVNDSKCTTLEALVWGLGRFPDKRIVLLAGGHAKGGDFRSVRDWIQRKVKQAILYGESQALLEASWEGCAAIARTARLEEAFQEALKVASSGDVVLLSPACASFDQFADYQERGRRFKQLVADLKGKFVPT